MEHCLYHLHGQAKQDANMGEIKRLLPVINGGDTCQAV